MMNRPLCFCLGMHLNFGIANLNSYHWNNWSVIHTSHPCDSDKRRYIFSSIRRKSPCFFLLFSDSQNGSIHTYTHTHWQTCMQTHKYTSKRLQVRKEAVCKWMFICICIFYTRHHTLHFIIVQYIECATPAQKRLSLFHTSILIATVSLLLLLLLLLLQQQSSGPIVSLY